MMGPAVLAAGWLAVGDRRLRLPELWTLAAAADLSLGEDCGVVYVVDRHTGHDEHDATPIEGTGEDRGDVNWWRVRVRRPAGVVVFVFVEVDTGSISGPWRNLTAGELARTFAAFERIVGVPWGDSIGHTAEALILSTHPRSRGGVLLDQSPVIPEPCLDGGLELAWQAWRRPLTDDERGARWVHVFDANAQYLAAWITAEVGHGVPVHHGAVEFDRKRAGVWRISPTAELLLAGVDELLPPIATPGREWFTTPTLARLADVYGGDAPAIAEAWLWPRKSRFFRAAGERLRDAREMARRELEAHRAFSDDTDDAEAVERVSRVVVAGAVLDAVKDLYRVQTGRFNMERDERSGWRRPDWGHTLRAQARVNLHRRLDGLGARPFAIATDGLMFATDEPDPYTFALNIRLPIGPNLGQFSHEGTAPAAPVWETFDQTDRGVLPLLRTVYTHREVINA